MDLDDVNDQVPVAPGNVANDGNNVGNDPEVAPRLLPDDEVPLGWTAACMEGLFQTNLLLQGLSLDTLGDTCFQPGHPNYCISFNVIHVAHFFSQGRARRANNNTLAQADVMCAGETLAYQLPQTYRNPQADARALVRNVILFGLEPDNRNGYTRITNETYAEAVLPPAPAAAGAPQPPDPRSWYFQNMPPTVDALIDAVPDMADEDLAKTLVALSKFSVSAEKATAVRVAATYVAAVCKLGTCTEAFTNKLANGILAETGLQVDLQPDTIQQVWMAYGKFLRPDTAREIIDHIDAILPDVALRLRLTVQQCKGVGMTCFTMITQALRQFPAFNWARIAQILDPEFTNYVLAVNQVQDNPYYGFNEDLGPAKSTHFKNLAWVARELLIRKAGLASLRRLSGMPRNPREADAVRSIIDDFCDVEIDNNAPVPAEFVNSVQDARNAVGNWVNLIGQ